MCVCVCVRVCVCVCVTVIDFTLRSMVSQLQEEKHTDSLELVSHLCFAAFFSLDPARTTCCRLIYK